MRFLHACVCHYPEDHLWAPSDGGSSACLAERTGGRVPQARVLCMPASATTLKTTCGHGPTGDPRLASPSGQEGGCRRHAFFACLRLPLPWRPPVGTVRRGILSLPRRADRRVGAAGMRFLHACVCHYPEDHLWARPDGGSSACLAERTGGWVPQACASLHACVCQNPKDHLWARSDHG